MTQVPTYCKFCTVAMHYPWVGIAGLHREWLSVIVATLAE